MLLIGCSSKTEVGPKKLPDGDKKLYEEVLIETDSNKALERLDALELYYPTSQLLPEVMTLKLYNLYKLKDYITLTAQAEKFISLYPNHPNTAYAYYMKGVANRKMMLDSRRDQRTTQEALAVFSELQEKFPASEYTSASKGMIDYSKNILSMHELEIGRFYAGKAQYGAAAARFQKILHGYQDTVAEPEAMYRMMEIHLNLQSYDYAQRYCEALINKYPQTLWAKVGKNMSIPSASHNNQQHFFNFPSCLKQ